MVLSRYQIFLAELTIERRRTAGGTAQMESASWPKQKLRKLDHAALDDVMAEDAEFFRGRYISTGVWG